MKLEIENHNDPYLFRYRPNNENTLDEIRNSYIYFPNRDKLNDPFDASQSLMDLKDNNEAINSYFNTIYEAAPQHQRNWLLAKFPKRNLEFYTFFKEGINQFINKYGIACFTVTPVHMVLWANYANNHQGVCIQYDSSTDPGFFHGMRSVNYVEKINKVSFDIINNAPAFENVFFTKASLWQGEYEVLKPYHS